MVFHMNFLLEFCSEMSYWFHINTEFFYMIDMYFQDGGGMPLPWVNFGAIFTCHLLMLILNKKLYILPICIICYY